MDAQLDSSDLLKTEFRALLVAEVLGKPVTVSRPSTSREMRRLEKSGLNGMVNA